MPLLLLLTLPLALQAHPLIRHDLHVVLQPEASRLQVTDTITLPAGTGPHWSFLLHAGLRPASSTPGVYLQPQPLPTGTAAVPLEAYTVVLPPATQTFVLHYTGDITHPLQQQGAEYARSFHETPGTITSAGVYLQAPTYWYPRADDALLTFTLEVQLPAGWDAVSQGQRTRHARSSATTQVRWESPQPQEQILLVAAPFTTYQQSAGPIQAQAFLRTPEVALAQQYLEATAQYVAMYSTLIGPYPYAKFALVENFWDSGYGMPSFTLLGPKVIRLPFILHSSYPHEILHNWWGNGVFVDDTGGNWCEGLTAYLADHLLQEQRGLAAEYRRTTLQNYTDYVAAHQDFALTAFRARHNAVTEAVGYGKALMFFHMLRQQLGDTAFTQALRTFYQAYRFQRASFDNLRTAFANATGTDLQAMFDQWITRPGAPELRLSATAVRLEDTAYLLTAVVQQVQPGPAYQLRLPLAVRLENQERAYETTVTMSAARLELTWHFPARPLRLDLDPQFDVFRRLHRQEIPPALTQMFGAEKVLILLPATAPEAVRQAYRQLAQHWQQEYAPRLEVRWDNEIITLPADRAVWLWGWENRWRATLATALAEYKATVAPDTVRLDETTLPRTTHTVVLTARHPLNPQHTLAWLATDNPVALPGLGRKLPHYGKYSYLGFTGEEPTNVVKGQWPVLQSPMTVRFSLADGRVAPGPPALLAPRQALAALSPAFSAERMLQVIQILAGPDMRGRGLGTPELEQAADFLAVQFREAGLQPGGDTDGSYFQTWTARGSAPERQMGLRNVVGILPGHKAEWAGQSVVVGAHYDHLGLGWPDVHQGDHGKVHPGADDNASGVAVLLELARALGNTWQPERSVVFVAFTGEEAGRLGSQYYVAHASRFQVSQSIGMLNFDAVGRLGQNKLRILGIASAREWPHIFQGASYVTGTPVEVVANDWGSSDHTSFLEAGVPAVQLFSGVHHDYHRPSDTLDKIDPQGLVRVATIAREALVYLASRAEPLTAPTEGGGGGQAARSAAAGPGRRVSLGTVPDFTYSGQGYRISEILPDSPAAQAGLQAGDIIVQLGTTAIPDLPAFANVLRMLQPGERITIIVQRGEAMHTIHAQLAPR